jgi:Zn-dependent peptidase ImmA (M78 family)
MLRTPKVKLNNPDLLRWARESAGYAPADIASHLRKPEDVVLAWESGEDAPTYRQLEEFAKKVKRPVAALFLPEVPTEPPRPEDFRLLPGRNRGEFTPQTLLAFRRLRNSMAGLRELTDDLADPLEFALPTWELADDAEEQAGRLRATLGVTVGDQLQWRDAHEALDEWRRLLFQHGVLVQVFPMPMQDARGFSLLAHDLGGVGISSRDAPPARVFSLFHEVAHLCLGRPGVSSEFADVRGQSRTSVARLERYCNRFAAALLLPREEPLVRADMETLAEDLTRGEAERRARKYAVSKYVVALRLGDLGLADSDRLQEEIDRWFAEDAREAERRTGRRRGGDSVRATVSHAGKPFVATVLEALDRRILTSHEAGRLLSLKARHLEDARLMLV